MYGAGLCAIMPPAGLQQTEMDEEALLELELQQELDRINLDNDPFADDADAEINNNDVPELDSIADRDAAFSLEGEVWGRGGGGEGGMR